MSNRFDPGGLSGLGSILRGVGRLIENAADIASIDPAKVNPAKTGELNTRYSFSLKVGIDGEDFEKKPTKPVFCVPHADVYEDGERLTAKLELPEADMDSLEYRLEGDTIVISAEGSGVIYRKLINIGSRGTAGDEVTVARDGSRVELTVRKS